MPIIILDASLALVLLMINVEKCVSMLRGSTVGFLNCCHKLFSAGISLIVAINDFMDSHPVVWKMFSTKNHCRLQAHWIRLTLKSWSLLWRVISVTGTGANSNYLQLQCFRILFASTRPGCGYVRTLSHHTLPTPQFTTRATSVFEDNNVKVRRCTSTTVFIKLRSID